jgi:hypothetical protein
MIFRGPGFLAVLLILLLTDPLPPLSRQQLVHLSQSSRVLSVELTDRREGGRGGGGAKAYDHENA